MVVKGNKLIKIENRLDLGQQKNILNRWFNVLLRNVTFLTTHTNR